MFDINRELDEIRSISLTPSAELIRETKRRIRRHRQNADAPEERPVWRRRAAWITVPMAAALAVVFAVNIVSLQYTAYYTVDINPGVGFSVNGDGIVTDVDLIDTESMDADVLRTLEGRPLVQVMDAVLAEAQRSGYIEPDTDVLVGCFAGQKHTAITKNQIGASLSGNIQERINLLYIVGTKDERKTAEQKDVSPGLYSLSRLAENSVVSSESDLTDVIAGVEAATGRDIEDLLEEKRGPEAYAAPEIDLTINQNTAVIAWPYIGYRKNNYDGTIIYQLACAKTKDALFDSPQILDEYVFEAWDKQPLNYALSLTDENRDRYYAVFAVYDDGTIVVDEKPVFIP